MALGAKLKLDFYINSEIVWPNEDNAYYQKIILSKALMELYGNLLDHQFNDTRLIRKFCSFSIGKGAVGQYHQAIWSDEWSITISIAV